MTEPRNQEIFWQGNNGWFYGAGATYRIKVKRAASSDWLAAAFRFIGDGKKPKTYVRWYRAGKTIDEAKADLRVKLLGQP